MPEARDRGAHQYDRTMNNTLSTQFEQYSAWRASVLQSVGEFQDWLQAQELYDAQADMRAQRIRGVLRSDRLCCL